MSVRGVKNTIQRVTTDGVMSKADAQEILAEAGEKVSAGEEEAIREAMNASTFEISPEAKTLLGEKLTDLGTVRNYIARTNSWVSTKAQKLESEEAAMRQMGVDTVSYGGTKIPEAVKAIVNKAIEAGAAVYDVAEANEDPVKDDHGGDGYTVEGKWSPYPQESQAVGNLDFAYTELTPEKIQADMDTETTYKVISGYKTETQTDMRTGQTHTFQVAQYEEVTGKGNGNISAFYDEAHHPDPYARARGGQKFASNFAIMSDGSFHAVPVARRNQATGGLILTNPSLGRGKRMLFNGHLEMRGGVVTGIGLSGRLHKMAADGEAKFVNPIPLLEAWGFKVDPNLKLRFEGSFPAPPVDPDTHVIG